MGRVTLRLPDELHRYLRRLGHRRGTSLNQVIVAALGETVHRDEEIGDERNALAEQVRLARVALADLTVEVDVHQPFPEGCPPTALPTDENAAESLPWLSPSLSMTVIDERRDRV